MTSPFAKPPFQLTVALRSNDGCQDAQIGQSERRLQVDGDFEASNVLSTGTVNVYVPGNLVRDPDDSARRKETRTTHRLRYLTTDARSRKPRMTFMKPFREIYANDLKSYFLRNEDGFTGLFTHQRIIAL